MTRSTGAFLDGSPIVRAPSHPGSLDGLDFAVKDLIDVAGTITGAGNPDWRAGQQPCDRSAEAVDRLLASGARLAGKTVTDELAFSLEGANAHYGTPLNPRAPDRLPGGSSSGSASAVASHAVDFALGTDTGGSVRIPASFCGLYGMRPSHGRIPLDNVFPFAASYDTIGWLARDAGTLLRVGEVLLQERAELRPARYLIATDAFALADQDVAEALMRKLPEDFRVAETITLYGGTGGDWLEAYRVLQGAEIWQTHADWIRRTHPRFGEAIAARFDDAATITAADVARWQPFREWVRGHLPDLLGADGLLIMPTSPTPALSRSASPEEIGDFYRRALTLTCVAGHAGLPQVTIPLGTVGKAPIGLSVIGAPGTDMAVLAQVARIFCLPGVGDD